MVNNACICNYELVLDPLLTVFSSHANPGCQQLSNPGTKEQGWTCGVGRAGLHLQQDELVLPCPQQRPRDVLRLLRPCARPVPAQPGLACSPHPSLDTVHAQLAQPKGKNKDPVCTSQVAYAFEHPHQRLEARKGVPRPQQTVQGYNINTCGDLQALAVITAWQTEIVAGMVHTSPG